MGAEAWTRPGQRSWGPWGNHTSSLDWCEDNYTHSTHIAEFWNTVSNIPFICLGIWGMVASSRLPNKWRLILAQSFLTIIGCGSFLFHSTLSWHAQVLFDELPMIWSAAMFLYLAIVGGAANGTIRLKLIMIAIPAIVSWVYLKFPNPVVHQVAYACLELVSVNQVLALLRNLPTSTALQARKKDECRENFIKGVATFILGFAIWNVDNILCDGLTSFRAGKGEIVGALTQGHAWWHLFTGIGASRTIAALTYVTLAKRQPDDFEFVYVLGHPVVKPVTDRVAGKTL